MKATIHTVMKAANRIYVLLAILGGSWFLAAPDANATHIVGGEITYRCLGNNMYEVRLFLRRDCLLGAPDAPFDDPASVGFFDATTNQHLSFIGINGQLFMDYNEDDTLNQTLISDCTIADGDICVHQTTYVDTIFLPFRPTGYIMAYTRCCRNASLNNIINPLATGMTVTATLSGFAQTECDDSPYFVNYPPLYICVNEPIVFDHHAEDGDADSLVYCLTTPWAGGDPIVNMPQPPPPPPFDPVTWRPPYSENNMLGGVPLMIDPQTGLLSGTPNTIGQFVVGICVTAYKNGVVTSILRRDFQYNVRACRDVPIADFAAPPLTCDGLTVNFLNQSQFSDNYIWYFNWEDPNSPTSILANPQFTFPEEGFYDVALISYDTNLLCYDTIIKPIGVFTSELQAAFEVNITECTESIVIAPQDQSTDPERPITGWEWLLNYPGGTLTSDQQFPVFDISVTGTSTVSIALTVTSDNGCTATAFQTFPVTPIDVEFNPDADNICAGESVNLLLNGNSDLTYIWSPETDLDLTEPWNPIASPGITTKYHVTVTDGNCVVVDSIIVNVQSLPNLSFTYDTDCKSLVATFTNTSTNAILYHWDFGDVNATDDTSIAVNPTFIFPGPGEYTVTLSSRDGCDVSISQVVTINTITETLDDELVNCFNPGYNLNPDFDPKYTYVWEPADFLDDPTSPNPFATVVDDTWFYVTITEASLPGCEIIDSVLLIIPDNFEVVIEEDSIVHCNFSPITLDATVSNPDLDIVWSVGGVQIGVGSSITVAPEVTTTYVATATDSLGCSKSDMVIVFIPDPTFSVNAEPDSAYCDIQTITLNATSSIQVITYEWFNLQGDLIGQGPTVDVTPGVPSCYYVRGTDDIGCQVSDTVCLTPTFFNVSITNDTGVCEDEEVQLCVTDLNNQNLTFQWSPAEEVLTGQGTSCITARPNDDVTFTVIVTNADVGCEETLTTNVDVFLFDPVDVVITADKDSVVLTETVQLEVNQDPGFDYMWSTSTGEIVDPVYNPVVTPTGNTTYTVTVTNEHGCTGVASYSIGVADPFCDDRDIFIPNAFTPDASGINDMLCVRSNFISTFEIFIYNRWGELVFQSNDVNNCWDGTYKGKELAPDVFGYYMNISCPNQKTFFKKGNITLLR